MAGGDPGTDDEAPLDHDPAAAPEDPARVRHLGVDVRSSASDAAWPARFGEDLALRPGADVAAVAVAQQVVLAREGFHRPVALDAVSSVLWHGFDGATTLRHLAEDLAAAGGGTVAERLGAVRTLAASLTAQGFLDGPRPPEAPLVRTSHPPVDPASCAGKRLGLGRTSLRQVAIGGRPVLRYGSSVEVLATAVDAALGPDDHLVDVDSAWVPTTVLRASPGRGRRLQQLFGTLAQPRYASRDLDEAGLALLRTVGGMLSAHRGGAWVDGPVLRSHRGAFLLHPSFHEVAIGEARTSLEDLGYRCAPTALVRLRLGLGLGLAGAEPTVELPAGPSSGGSPAAEVLPLAGVLIPDPGPQDPASLVLATAHLAHRWDQEHLEAVAALVTRHPALLRVVPRGIRESPTAALLDVLADHRT